MTGIAQATAIDFSTLGTYQTSNLVIADLSVTASDQISVLALNGLGVADYFLGGTEWMKFSFTGNPVSNVILNSSLWGTGYDGDDDEWFKLTAYGNSGQILGTHSVLDFDGFHFNVNSLTGANSLSAFTIQMHNDITIISSISYDAAPVPEPATMLLMGSGLAGLIGARRKKKA